MERTMTKALRQLIVVCVLASAAFGQGLLLEVQNQGTTIATWKKFGIINCTTNLTCTASGSTVNVVASSTAATAFSALTASANANAGSFSASGNSWDFTATTFLGLRVGTGLVTTKNGDIGFDTTNGNWHLWNGADRILAPLASGFVSGHC